MNVDIFTDASCQHFSRRLSVTIPAQSGQLGGPPVFQQSHYFNLEIGEGVYIVRLDAELKLTAAVIVDT